MNKHENSKISYHLRKVMTLSNFRGKYFTKCLGFTIFMKLTYIKPFFFVIISKQKINDCIVEFVSKQLTRKYIYELKEVTCLDDINNNNLFFVTSKTSFQENYFF